MNRILVTGMSGTGKSAVLAELTRRGNRVVDTDYDGWSEDVPLRDGSGLEQLWREDLMSVLLAQDSDEPLFVSGCTSNQSKFYDRFDAVVLLTAPSDVLLDRLATRTTNPFGKDPSERDRILKDLATVEPWLRSAATIVISTRGRCRTSSRRLRRSHDGLWDLDPVVPIQRFRAPSVYVQGTSSADHAVRVLVQWVRTSRYRTVDRSEGKRPDSMWSVPESST